MYRDKTKVAVIDLGTNTFHMVIFQQSEDKVEELYRKRYHVFLSANGIKTIGQEPYSRAQNAVIDYQKAIKKYQPDIIKIIGTEALRVASNGPELSSYISEILDSEVEIISGEREAELIAKGVLWEFKSDISNAMIMDIGGGSVEFIHIIDNEIKWLKSFPIGVGVLFNNFNHSEPVTLEEINTLEKHLENSTIELLDYISTQDVDLLIGSSGSFEIIPGIMEAKYPPEILQSLYTIEEFNSTYDKIIHSSLDERKKIKGLPPVRAQLIVVAFILMRWIIKKIAVKELKISRYAVKEGLAAETLGI